MRWLWLWLALQIPLAVLVGTCMKRGAGEESMKIVRRVERTKEWWEGCTEICDCGAYVQLEEKDKDVVKIRKRERDVFAVFNCPECSHELWLKKLEPFLWT